MKKLLLYLTFIFLAFSTFSKEKEAIKIGILYDEFVSTHGLHLIEKEITDLIGNEYDISFPKDKQLLQNNNDRNEINKNLELIDDKYWISGGNDKSAINTNTKTFPMIQNYGFGSGKFTSTSSEKSWKNHSVDNARQHHKEP